MRKGRIAESIQTVARMVQVKQEYKDGIWYMASKGHLDEAELKGRPHTFDSEDRR